MLRPALLFYCGQVRLVNWKYTKNYTICRVSVGWIIGGCDGCVPPEIEIQLPTVGVLIV